jgi:hypothetical protein
MTTLFRTVLLVATALLVVAVFVPFEHPLRVDVQLNQPAPAWIIFSGGLILVVLAAAVACVGLFLFRRWARWFGMVTAVAAAIDAWLLSGSPLAASLGGLTVTLLSLSGLVWVSALALSFQPSLSGKFRHGL